MTNNNIFAEITRKASTTFYTATLFFPKQIREDVFILYSFVRTADDLIDTVPSKKREFNIYRDQTYLAFNCKKSGNIIIDSFVLIAKRKKIPLKIITSFFESLELDSKAKTYPTYHDLCVFIYGTAEVIGLLMSYIMNLPRKSYPSAQKLGRAMQLVNILRDIEEDLKFGRVYIPQNELNRFRLPAVITRQTAYNYPDEFQQLINFQGKRIIKLINESRKGFTYIPRKHLLPIKTSADLYEQITKLMMQKPQIIFQKKLKPSKLQIMFTVIKNYWLL